MRSLKWLIIAFTLTGTQAFAAESVSIGCKKLIIVLDQKLNIGMVEQDWGSGQSYDAKPAILELRGCKGELIDHVTLAAPLARIDLPRVQGTTAPTYLVSADLTESAGSYNGPLTTPFEIADGRLHPVTATFPDGTVKPLRLSITGKSSWKRVKLGKHEVFLSIQSYLENNKFITNYYKYVPTRGSWRVRQRSESGLWESDGAFPKISKFP